MSTPTYGSAGRTFEKRENAIADAGGPRAEVLGTVNERIINPDPPRESATWTRDSGETIEFVTPPPPWETEPGKSESDARQFVDVPQEWSLRWINPKLLDQFGWRYWQPVMASDPRVKVKVSSMVDVSNNIRRGGQTGDVLAWMYTTWVEARRQKLAAQTRRLTDSAPAKQEALKEEFRRGTFGPYVQFAGGTHPTHTMGDGKTMRD